MESHALQYSKGYRAKKVIHSGKKILMVWPIKRCFASLLSKWGVLSVEMQKALEADMAIIKEDGSYDYVDNEPEPAHRKSSKYFS